jgi:hypothetical protein
MAAAPDRLSLQRARDELVKTVLALEKRVAEAEDEAARAVQAAAAAAAAQADHAAAHAGGRKGDARALHRDLEMLLVELDRERQANTELSNMLEAAHAEAAAERRARQAERAAPAAPGDAEATPAQLQERVAVLKGARDRLLAALDGQAAEAERLAAESAALGEALGEAQACNASWEAAAQAGLAQSERLKELLEESAAWEPPVTGAAHAPEGNGGGGGAAAAAAQRRCEALEREALLQRARCAELETQVRALCAELTRAAGASAAARRAVLPALGGVEARLAGVLRLKPRGLAG